MQGGLLMNEVQPIPDDSLPSSAQTNADEISIDMLMDIDAE